MTGTEKSDIDKLDIVIRQADGQVVAGIPQIALYAKADSAAAALDMLERKKDILKRDIAAAGIIEPLPLLAGTSAMPSATDEIGRFAIKAGIIAVMILLVLAVSGSMLASRIEATARTIIANDIRGGRQFWTNLEQGIERMADPSNEMSEERKQKLVSNIRVLVNRVRPFTAELAPLFAAPPSSR